VLPDSWLVNPRVRKLRQKFLSVPRTRFLDLAEHMFGTIDLDRQQLGALVQLLTDSQQWPTIDRVLASSQDDAEDLDIALAEVPRDSWLPEVLPLLVEMQSGSSVLDLGCHQGHCAQMFTGTSFYEGHDVNSKRVAVAKRVNKEQQFHVTDLSRWLAYEPKSSYSLVLVHLPDVPYTCNGPCLETQRGPELQLNTSMLEWGAKCCVRGGIMIGVTSETTNLEPALNWLRTNGTLLLVSRINQSETLIIYRHGIRMRDYPTVTDEFADYLELTDFAMSRGYLARTPVSVDDPRPMQVADWGIELAPQASFKFSGTDATLLYKTKHAAGIWWQNEESALGWAMHQALKATREESWNKTIQRFNQRLDITEYLKYRTQPLHELLNLTANFKVAETPELAGCAKRMGSRLNRLRTSYPERSTVENRYYSLGPGDILEREGERWSVQFSEPDFSGKNPPKLHLQRMT
jgi:hypothetical protein